jgi:hypothetical protein
VIKLQHIILLFLGKLLTISAKDKTQLQKLLQSKMCTHISLGGLLKVNTKSGIVTPKTELMQRKTPAICSNF